MGDDITITTALFQMVQRIEDKIDNVKDDLSSVKSKQAVIETTLQDHIENTSHSIPSSESGMTKAQSLLFRWCIPIALALIMIGRASVQVAGQSKMLDSKAPQNTSQMVRDDTFVARNDRLDSIIRSQFKKSIGGP